MNNDVEEIDRTGDSGQVLAKVGLDWAELVAFPATKQAHVIRYLLPEELAEDEQADLADLLQKLWQIHKTTPKLNKVLGAALLELAIALNEPEQASTIFAALYPESDAAHVMYYERAARLCLAQGDNLGAWEAAIDLRRSFPAAITTQHLLADLLLKMNDWVGARGCYETILQSSPENARALLGLARCELNANQPEKACEIALQVENSAKISWRVLKQLAQFWRDRGDISHADQLETTAQLWRERGLLALIENSEKDPENLTESETLASSKPQGQLLEGIQIQNPENYQPDFDPNQVKLDPLPVLRQIFGYQEFKPGQAEVIESVLAGRDTLAVLPTGGGKSLCYQLPALLLERPVLVISPLISLMKDQFDNLPPELQEHSAVINSSLEPGEAARILRQMANKQRKLKLVYAAPERLRQYPFVAAMSQAGLGLLVVDEAHCVTIWGNDFRPDYLFIRQALEDLAANGNRPTVLAVTATATPEIASEIGHQLNRQLIQVRGTMFRPNLQYRVIKASNNEEREGQIVALCRELEGSGIIYVRSRDNAERLAYLLKKGGVSAAYYHARLNPTERKRTHEDWSENRVRVVVATVAFGMGIDKPDVRFIVHYNMSDSVENYVQESGRAGRDGLPSECVLFYTPSEKGSLTRFRRADAVDIQILREVFRAVKKLLTGRSVGLINQERLLNELNPGLIEYDEPKVSETQMRVSLSLLERAEILTRRYDVPLTAEITLLEPNLSGTLAELALALQLPLQQAHEINLPQVAAVLDCPLPQLEPLLLGWARDNLIRYRPNVGKREMLLELTPVTKENNSTERIQNLLDKMDEADEQRVAQITKYAKTDSCRHAFLAQHFGERLANPKCGTCDNCMATSGKATVTKTVTNLPATYQILNALASLRPNISVGRSGLKAILLGSDKAPQAERSNPGWAALEGQIKQKALDELIEQLVQDGYIAQQSVAGPYGQSYQALTLADKGQEQLQEGKAESSNKYQVSSIKSEFGSIKAELTRNPVPSNNQQLTTNNSFTDNQQPTTDNLSILACLETISPPGEDKPKVGRTGLIRLLLGQPSALGTTASNPYKGVLAGKFKEKEIEAQISELVNEGYIEQQEAQLSSSGRTYMALRLSDKGYKVLRTEDFSSAED